MKGFEGKFAFLSNFYPSPIVLNGVTYPTAEHLYQACKAARTDERTQIHMAKTPGQAKRLGKKCLLRKGWDRKMSLRAMKFTLRQKFEQNSELMYYLLNTPREMLVEYNHWHDNFWGHCTCPKCRDLPKHNMLGKLLAQLKINEVCPG